MFEIRPLTVGEVLDESFVLMRRAFGRLLLFPLIAFFPTAFSEAVIIRSLGKVFGALLEKGMAPGQLSVAAMGLLAVLAVQLVIGPPVTAALIRAVADTYLGRKWTAADQMRLALRTAPRTIGAGFLLVLIFVPVVGIPAAVAGALMWSIWGGGLALGPTALLVIAVGAVVIAVPVVALVAWIYLRFGLALMAMVVEDLSIVAAFKRSAALMARRYWAALGLWVVLIVVGLLFGFIASAFVPSPSFEVLDPDRLRQILPELVRSQTLSTILGEATGMITRTYGVIAWTLFYFSARCEREGFDLAHLAEQMGRKEAA